MSLEVVGRKSVLPILLLWSLGSGAQPDAVLDPSDPYAEVPASVYQSVLPQPTLDPVSRLDPPQLPWRGLYQPDGRFVPESAFAGSSDQTTTDSGMPEGEMAHDSVGHGDGSTPAVSPGASDARGVVKKIYPDEGKVKLAHGPIGKLDMPGMTMIFHVKDPALLGGLTEGEEIGFDVELEGTTLYVTGVER